MNTFLYSKTLYSIYLNSGGLGIFFLVGLALLSIFQFKYFKGSYLYLFLTFVSYSFIELVNHYFLINNWIEYPYSIIACIVPTIFYIKSINNSNLNIFILIIIIVYILSCLFQIYYSLTNKILLQRPYLFPMKNILTIVLGLILYSKLLKSPKVKSLKSEPSFWFNIGFLFINLSNLIILPIFNAVTPFSDNLAFVFGILYQIADPITYTLWAIGIYKLKTQAFRPIASLWP